MALQIVGRPGNDLALIALVGAAQKLTDDYVFKQQNLLRRDAESTVLPTQEIFARAVEDLLAARLAKRHDLIVGKNRYAVRAFCIHHHIGDEMACMREWIGRQRCRLQVFQLKFHLLQEPRLTPPSLSRAREGNEPG